MERYRLVLSKLLSFIKDADPLVVILLYEASPEQSKNNKNITLGSYVLINLVRF